MLAGWEIASIQPFAWDKQTTYIGKKGIAMIVSFEGLHDGMTGPKSPVNFVLRQREKSFVGIRHEIRRSYEVRADSTAFVWSHPNV